MLKAERALVFKIQGPVWKVMILAEMEPFHFHFGFPHFFLLNREDLILLLIFEEISVKFIIKDHIRVCQRHDTQLILILDKIIFIKFFLTLGFDLLQIR